MHVSVLKLNAKKNRVSDHVMRLLLYAPMYSTKFAITLQSASRSFLVRTRLHYLNGYARVIQRAWASYQYKRYCAIQCVQKMIRGVQGRRKAAKRRDILWVVAESYVYFTIQAAYKEIRCATLLQRVWRSSSAGKKYRRRQLATLQLQSLFRMRIARRTYLTCRRSAIKLQSRYRSHAAAAMLRGVKSLVTRLSAAYKMHKARQAMLLFRSSATRIAARWRAKAVQSSYLNSKRAAISMQAVFRMRAAKNRLKRSRKAATGMQMGARKMLARGRYLKMKKCALRVQCRIRSHVCQQAFAKIKLSTIKVQNFARYCIAKRVLGDLRDEMKATICLQNVWRACQWRRWWKHLRARRWRACTMLQAACRGASVRSSRRNAVRQVCRTYTLAIGARVLRAAVRTNGCSLFVCAQIEEDSLVFSGILVIDSSVCFRLVVSGSDLVAILSARIFPGDETKLSALALHLARCIRVTKSPLGAYSFSFCKLVTQILPPKSHESIYDKVVVAAKFRTTASVYSHRKKAAEKSGISIEHHIRQLLLCDKISPSVRSSLEFALASQQQRQSSDYPVRLFIDLRTSCYQPEIASELSNEISEAPSIGKSLFETVHDIYSSSKEKLEIEAGKLLTWSSLIEKFIDDVVRLQDSVHRAGDCVVEKKLHQKDVVSKSFIEARTMILKKVAKRQQRIESLQQNKCKGTYDAFDAKMIDIFKLHIKKLELDASLKHEERLVSDRLVNSLSSQQMELEKYGILLAKLEKKSKVDVAEWSRDRALAFANAEWERLSKDVAIIERILAFARRRARLRLQQCGSIACRYSRYFSGNGREISPRENEMGGGWGYVETGQAIASEKHKSLFLWSEAYVWNFLWRKRFNARLERVVNGELCALKILGSDIDRCKEQMEEAEIARQRRDEDILSKIDRLRKINEEEKSKIDTKMKREREILGKLSSDVTNYWWYQYVERSEEPEELYF